MASPKAAAEKNGGTESSSLTPSSRAPRKELGFGEGVCTCAGCMRKAPPIREDSSARIAALAVLYAKHRERQSGGGGGGGGKGAAPKPNDRDKELATALMGAMEAGNAQRVDELLRNGFVCEIIRADAATELILSAAQLGHASVINTLARVGADLEITDEVRGGRPLMHAATNGHAAAATSLLKHGAEREARDWNGYTALMIAVFSDRSTTASALLDHGAAVDAIDDKGRTSLCHAARYGSTDCIHVLAEHGADVFAVDEDSLNPLDIAEQNGRAVAAAALRKLEQRQRLQDKRLLRQKLDTQGGSGGGKGKGGTSVSKEQADLNMQALLLELEEDEKSQQERKAAKKAKKKGKQGKKKAAAEEEDEEEERSAKDDLSLGSRGDKATQRKAAAAAARGAHWSDSPAFAAAPEEQQNKPHEERQHAQEPKEEAPAPPEEAAEPGSLKDQWTVLLEEAVNCKEVDRILVLAAMIESLMTDVAESGASVKYGKKVLAKLQKVPPAKEALEAAMSQPDAALRPSELQAVVDAACRVRHHLDAKMVEDAEARLERLLMEHEEAKWAKLKAELRVPGAADTHGAYKPNGIISTKEPVLHHAEVAHSENECIVCLAASKDAVLIPCGHICMCFECSKQVQASSNACPICRAQIDHAFQVL